MGSESGKTSTPKGYIVYEARECHKCKGKGRIDHKIMCWTCSARGYTFTPVDLLEVLKKLRWTVSGDATEIGQWGKFEDLEVDDEKTIG
jgi:hypothetical protein